MSNPTSNFNWQMPTATDLVTDLPADFEVFGQAVDTSLADLKGGTSGQILAKNTNTDMDFVWITNDVGDITAVTAGTGISGGGTSGAVTITNSMATEITAKGDLIVGTGNAAFDNLPAGTNGHVLTADSTVSPTGLKWAALPAGGAYTSLASGSITNGLSLTSISGSYTDLYLVLTNFAPTVTDIIGVRINNDATSANYVGGIVRDITGGTGPSVQANSWAFVDVNCNSSVKQSTTGNSAFLYFSNYANTTGYKVVTADGGSNNNLSTYTSGHNTVTYLSTSAITRLDLKTAGSDWANQGTYVLYGVK